MKAYKRLSILCIAVLLCALLPVLAGATSPEDPPEAVDTNAVYVRANGNDTAGNGSQEDPYATLAKAVEMADDGATIYVMSNLTSTKVAKVWDKTITITSEPDAMAKNNGNAFTITRGDADTFDLAKDDSRSFYNPAMIEVGGDRNNGIVSSLTLKDIIFDDAGKTGGNANPDELYFMQAGPTAGISSMKIVQDAIIATYDGKGEITLDKGAILKNFGGMSAVRLAGGKLTMKDGSLICDDSSQKRVAGKFPEGKLISFGPAGAVWMQSGELIMEPGSRIDNVYGRSIYNEQGTATIGGTISNGRAAGNVMLQNDGSYAAGYLVYLRNGAQMTLTSTGVIEDTEGGNTVNQMGTAIYVMGGSEIITEENSEIRNLHNDDRIIYAEVGGNSGSFAGKIYNCRMNNAIGFSGASEDDPYYAYIAPSASFYNNVCVNYGIIYLQSHGTLDFYGKIYNNTIGNTGGGIALANNMIGTKAIMYEGAEITNNTVECTYNEWEGQKNYGGGGVTVRCGTFIMEGGVISNNLVRNTRFDPADCFGGGVQVTRGGTFIMNGGEITNNATMGSGGGVGYNGSIYQELDSQVHINGGTISGNKMHVTVAEDGTINGGIENDLAIVNGEHSPYGTIDRYFTVSTSATIGNPDVYMQKYDFTLLDPQRGTKLGNASKNGEEALTNASTEKGWSNTLLASFWAQSASNETWELNGLTTDNAQLPVYALVMPTDPEGNVADGAKAAVYAVTIDGDTWRFAVPAGGTSGYVVGLVQPTEDYGTLALTVSPTQVTEGEDSHTFQYQAVYTISDSLKNMLDQEPNVGDFTLTFVLDNNLTCTDANDANYDSDTHTLTVTVPADKLDGYTFHFSAETADGTTLTAGDQLVTSAVLSGQVGTTQVTVPSAPAVVEVVAQTPVAPPVTPSEPADPDDTGVSDLLDTENHNQYLFGYPEGTFGPDQNMTRAEVAQMFYNLLVDKNVAITASFEDVPADAWYAKSVNTLASMGIISGVGENRFEPERSITRAEFTSMAMKFTKGALDGTNVFSDVRSGDWFYEAVVGSIQYGWIEGYEDGTFRPENRITRVEVTSIVNKMLGRFADREFVAGHADELNSFSDVTSTHWGYYHIVEATNSHTYTKPSTNVETWTELK